MGCCLGCLGFPHLASADRRRRWSEQAPLHRGGPGEEEGLRSPRPRWMPAARWLGARPGVRSCVCGSSGALPAPARRPATTTPFPPTLKGARRSADRTRRRPARPAPGGRRRPQRHAALGSFLPNRENACPVTVAGIPTNAWTALDSVCTANGTRPESIVRNA